MVGKNMNPKLKIFISFLKREGCYEAFKDNYLNTEKNIPACHVRYLKGYDSYIKINQLYHDWCNYANTLTCDKWNYNNS